MFGRRGACAPGRVGGVATGLDRATLSFPLLIALAFPFLQVARFSEAASEMADRASTFVFMAMALVAGAWLASALTCGAGVVRGGAARARPHDPGSGPDWQRVPGPFLAGAEQRSVELHRGGRAVGRQPPAGRLQRRRRRDVQPGDPELRRRHGRDPAGGLRERHSDVHLRVLRPDLARADPAQRGRLRGRRHQARRPDGALRRVLRGRRRLRRGGRDGDRGDGVQVRGGAGLRAGPGRAGQDLRRPVAARRSRAVRGPAEPGVSRGPGPRGRWGRHRGAAAGGHRAASAPVRPAALPRRQGLALRAHPPGRDGDRCRRRRPGLRRRGGSGRGGGAALCPAAAQHRPRAAAAPAPFPGVVAVDRPDRGPGRATTVAVAIWSTWHGLLDFSPLPPPLVVDP